MVSGAERTDDFSKDEVRLFSVSISIAVARGRKAQRPRNSHLLPGPMSVDTGAKKLE
jgi:hypothetical protein